MSSSSSFFSGTNPTPTEYQTAVDLVAQATQQATAALASQTASATSAQSSQGYSTAAGSSATSATNQASAAATSATGALSSKTAAETAATNAATSATNAANSASSVLTSETNAAASAATATTQATAASTSATNAASSSSAAGTSATNASNSASGAATSATTATNQATAAGTSATNAANSASAASTSATNAATSATGASGSATTATTQATNASNSASAASTSATNAATSASAASTSATNAASSATAAATSASNAASTLAGALTKTDNLASLSNVSTARTNLGLTALATTTPGTNVATALGVAVGTAGAFVTNGDALGTPASGTLTNCTFPTLNQNTTGTAAGLSATLAVGSGGSGTTTAQGAINAFAGAVTSGSYLRGNGTNVVMSAIQAADVPTLNQNTTGTASNVTGTVAVANGGTGLTSLTAGRIPYGAGTSAFGNSSGLTFGVSTWGTAANSVFQITGTNASYPGRGSALTLASQDGLSNVSVANDTGSQALQFYIGTSEKMRITSTGTVNIVGAGTAGSTQAVSLNGSAPINSMVLDASGRLGIGTTSPLQPLVVSNGGAQGIEISPTATASAPVITCYNRSTAAFIGLTQYASKFDWSIGASPAMTLDASGNLLVGTTTADAKFYVVNGTASKTAFRVNGVSGAQILFDYNGGGASYYDASSHNFRTIAGAPTATIDSSGNLGLGVTPSAWYANRKAFQVGSGSCVNGSVAVNDFTEIGSNFYVNSGGADTYIATSTATKYRQLSGAHSWYNAPSGTAGNAISGANAFVQTMTLDASGNLGIGTTSPACRLDIQGAGGSTALQIKRDATSVFQIYQGSGITYLDAAASGGAFQFASNGSPTMRIDSSGNLLVGTTSNPYTTNKTAISGGTFYNQYAVVISTSGTTLFNGVAGMVVLRSNTTGGSAIIAFDVSTGISIVGQSGSVFTTSSPSASQIQLSVGTSPFRLIATAGSSKNGDTVNFGTVLCQ